MIVSVVSDEYLQCKNDNNNEYDRYTSVHSRMFKTDDLIRTILFLDSTNTLTFTYLIIKMFTYWETSKTT